MKNNISNTIRLVAKGIGAMTLLTLLVLNTSKLNVTSSQGTNFTVSGKKANATENSEQGINKYDVDIIITYGEWSECKDNKRTRSMNVSTICKKGTVLETCTNGSVTFTNEGSCSSS